MPKEKNSRTLRLARHKRVRNKVSGTPQRPRLCVFRSLRHTYAQVVDDVSGHTIAYASSMEPEIKPLCGKRCPSPRFQRWWELL